MNAEVVVLGEAMALFLAGDGLPLLQARHFERAVAGAESNVAIALARLGHRVAFVGNVGDDTAGKWVREGLRREGVDIAHLATDHRMPTGLIHRDYGMDSRATTVDYFRLGSASSALNTSALPISTIRQARAIYVSGITAMLSPSAEECVSELFKIARSANVPICFDPNVRLKLAPVDEWRRVVVPLMTQASTVFAGRDELAILGIDGAGLLSDVTRTLVIKSGAMGVFVQTLNDCFTQPALPVAVVDTVGAGDAFTAGWISATLRGMDPRGAARVAATVASYVVASAGDVSGLPTSSELAKLFPMEYQSA